MTNQSLASAFADVNNTLSHNGNRVFTTKMLVDFLGLNPGYSTAMKKKALDAHKDCVRTIKGDELAAFREENNGTRWSGNGTSLTVWDEDAAIFVARALKTEEAASFLESLDVAPAVSVKDILPPPDIPSAKELKKMHPLDNARLLKDLVKTREDVLRNCGSLFVKFEGRSVLTNDVFCALFGIKKEHTGNFTKLMDQKGIKNSIYLTGQQLAEFKLENINNPLVSQKARKHLLIWEIDAAVFLGETMADSVYTRAFKSVLFEDFKKEVANSG